MERKVKVAAIQMSCSRDITENIEKADRLVRDKWGKNNFITGII